MATYIQLKNVKTEADVQRYLGEECVTDGLATSIGVSLFGVIAIPLALRKHYKKLPIPVEYQLAIGAISMMAISYFSGLYVRKRCEQNAIKLLQEHFDKM